ncbi:hypothetical protein CEXT_593151 [Caerostris extrusa]|uniref:Uncharacterized protein n=1 Tax=Caerostris extrusa TaxID=172846 RepID=A0AAV4P895_CAEEX|nr:hypothetical protein CEXT_593151 [Caerostris extrusa]
MFVVRDRKALPNPGLQHRCRSARHGDGRPLAASPCNAGAPRSTRTEGLLCLPSGAHRIVQSRPRTAQRHPHRVQKLEKEANCHRKEKELIGLCIRNDLSPSKILKK